MTSTIGVPQRLGFYLGLLVIAIVCYAVGFTTAVVGLLYVGAAAEIAFWLGFFGWLGQRRRDRRNRLDGP